MDVAECGRRGRWYLGALALGALYLLSPWRFGVVCGESMEPTLRSGSPYLLDHTYYQHHPVRHGDVVVFKRDGVTYVKRVQALAGDSLLLLKSRDNSAEDQVVMYWQKRLLRKAVNSTLRNTQKLVQRRIGEGYCYVLGDHLWNSEDSRSFGPIPTDTIIGRVLFAPPPVDELREIAMKRDYRRTAVSSSRRRDGGSRG